MKDALLKIKERLSSKLDYLATKSIDEKAVYIATERTALPVISDFPAIALKDGEEVYELAGGTLNPTDTAGEYSGEFDKTMTVEVTAFVRIRREEDIITGDVNEEGILDLVGDIKTALTGWLPADEYNAPLVPVRSSASQVVIEEDGERQTYIQMKTITFRFAKQE